MICRRYLVSGRVQGVWFRDSTRRQAERLCLTGTAINLRDGRVEVTACGTADGLAQLQAWLRHGPELARVDTLVSESVADQIFTGFSTG